MAPDTGYLSRDEAKAEALFDVEVGEGKKVQCRVVSASEMLAAKIVPPALVTLDMTPEEKEAAGEAAAHKMVENIKTDMDAGNRFLQLALVQPKMWLGDEDLCPSDHVTPLTYGPFRDATINGVLPEIGYGESRRKAVDFRDPLGAGAVAPGDGADAGSVPAQAS